MIYNIIRLSILFLLPFLAYSAYALSTKKDIVESLSHNKVRYTLVILGFIFAIVGVLIIAVQQEMGSEYIPAHVVNGVLVPSELKK